MNQIEWCQVRLDITQRSKLSLEIQVTRRSKLPGDPALGNLPGDPMLGNLPRDPVLGNLIVLKPSTHRHNCFAEN